HSWRARPFRCPRRSRSHALLTAVDGPRRRHPGYVRARPSTQSGGRVTGGGGGVKVEVRGGEGRGGRRGGAVGVAGTRPRSGRRSVGAVTIRPVAADGQARRGSRRSVSDLLDTVRTSGVA